MRGELGSPVVIGVAFEHDLRLRIPLHELERTGADRAASIIRAGCFQGGGRRNAQPLAGSIAQEQRIGSAELDGDSVIIHHNGFDVGMIGQQRFAAGFKDRFAVDVIEGRLDRFSGERRAVVEGHIIAQGEGELGVIRVRFPVAGEPRVQFAVRGDGQERIKDVHQNELLLHVHGVTRVERFRLDGNAEGEGSA